MASRRKGRILAFQALYFWEASQMSNSLPNVPIEELVTFAWLDEPKLSLMEDNGTADFSRLMITGTIENIKEIDKKIKKHLEHWDIKRLNRVDLAVLRLSCYSLIFQNDISPSIIIDEAIGICREFGSDDSYKFINGVLDSIRKSIQQDTCQKADKPYEKLSS